MTAFPARGQKAPAYWDTQLKAYIDEHDASMVVDGITMAHVYVTTDPLTDPNIAGLPDGTVIIKKT
jgi:hypothetical protein